MASLNKVMIIGNVGKDPEIRTTQDGREIASLTVATSESWKDKSSGERREKTEWHKVVVFNPNIVNVLKKYVAKGSKIFIEGQLQTRKWQDNSGQDRYVTEIVIQAFNGNLILLDNKKPDSENINDYALASSGSAKPVNFASDPELDDEIAF